MKKLFIFVGVLCLLWMSLFVNRNENIKKINSKNVYQKPVIVVDAGHGEFDGGAKVGEFLEKDLNLSFSLSLEKLLVFFGYEVKMTRTNDMSMCERGLGSIRQKKISDTRKRLELIEQSDVLCSISIHQNIFSQSRYSGAQTFYGQKNEKSQTLAVNILDSVKELLQKDNKRIAKPIGRQVYLIHNSTKPSVLMECGFMSNGEELKNLTDKTYQQKMNFCIVAGILKGF